MNATNSSARIEVVSRGTTVVLILESAGTFTLTITDPGKTPVVAPGTWSASGDVLTLTWTQFRGEAQFDMTMSGDTLALDGGHVAYDVNRDGIDEEAVLTMTLARQ